MSGRWARWRVRLGYKGWPPVVRRMFSFHTVHAVVFLSCSVVGLATSEPGSKVLWRSPSSVSDWAVLLQVAYGALFIGWITHALCRSAGLADGALRVGGTACVHCAYGMDPTLAEGVCPECGGVYRRAEAVRMWSAVWPQRARRYGVAVDAGKRATKKRR